MPPPQLPNQNASETSIALSNTVKYLVSRLPSQLAKPKVAIICGSGLGGLAGIIDQSEIEKVEFDYVDIPGFAHTTVQGHAGKLVFGLIGANKTPTVCMIGRFHCYEGYSTEQTTFPVRAFKLLGVEILIVTNATGSLNEHFQVGDITVIADHISLPGLAGFSPLTGPNLSEFGPRFPPMSDAYDFELRQIAFRASSSLNFKKGSLKEGVYVFVGGPSYETRAEARFLKSIGADVVGMSTVPEVVVARHCGLRVLGLSLVSNMVLMARHRSADPEASRGSVVQEKSPSHEDVLAASQASTEKLQALVQAIISKIQ